jgi:transmembrane sensor
MQLNFKKFMTQQEFDKLSEKYLNGKCSVEEITFLEDWANMQSEIGIKASKSLNEEEIENLKKNLWQKIRKEVNIHSFDIWRNLKWMAACIAASVFFTIGYFFYNTKQPVTISKIKLPNGIESKNIAEKQQKVLLPDGSIVILEKNSSLITDENYGKINRKVYLNGEAFFEVTPNAKKPFLVYIGSLVTEVLGTSFRIKPKSNNKTIEVSVKTGKVSVYATEIKKTGKLNGVILTPNQKVIYDTQLKTISQSIVDEPLIVAAFQKSDFQFEEAKLENVVKTFQQAYGVEIMVSNQSLNLCEFTGDLNGLSLYKQLDFLCGSFNAQYELRGTTIFILGEGCK